MSEDLVNGMSYEDAVRIVANPWGEPPTHFAAAQVVIARKMIDLIDAADIKARLLPLPHHAHPDRWTCNDCEDVRLHNERIMAGGTR